MSNMNKVAKELKKAMTESDERKPKAYDTEATVTHVDGNTLWVKFPGGETETPVRRTIDAKPGDVVMVRVANHRAWTGGNSTNPPTDDTRANQVGAAAQPSIDFVAELRDKDVTVKSITAATGYIDDLYSKNIHTENLEATTAYIKDLTAEEIEAGAITTKTLDAKYATIDELHADYAHIKDGVIDNAKIGYADVQDLHAHYAALDFANVLTADIQEAWIKNLMVQGQMVAQDGTIYRLTGLHLNANDIDVGQLKADRLLLLGDDGLYYSINVNTLGESYIEQCTEEEQLEFRRTIHADVITANSITVDKITTNNLIGTGGWINLRSGTFSYENASTGDGISWDGQHLSLRGDVEITSNNYYTKTDVDGLIGDIQDQVDGVIDTWYYAVDPTTSNAPASSWTTDDDRYNHLRDLYFNTENGHSFRWAIERTNDASVVSGKRYYIRNSSTGKYEYVSNPTTSGLAQYFEYQWIEIKDADAIKALSDAAKAQETADGKRRVFTAQPTNAQEYDVGDLWVNATYGTTYNNDILKCKTAKAAGAAFNINHWALASKYTDDSNVYKKSDFSITPEAIISKVTAIEGWEIGGRNLASKVNITAYQTPYTEDNYVYTGQYGNGAGLKFLPTIFTVGESYVLSFKIQKVSGTLTGIGGHQTGFTCNEFFVDGTKVLNTYSNGTSIADGTDIHEVVVCLTYNGNASDNALYIQPNRNNYISQNNSTFKLWDIMLEHGNKATAWTPAPEDTDAKISELNTSISETAEAIKLEASRRESSVNLLLDSDAPSLTKVHADYNRYISNGGNTMVTPTYITLNDPPEAGIEHAARFVCDGTNTTAVERAYTFYEATVNAIPYVTGQTYTATWWARYTSGTAGTLKTRILYPKGDGGTNNAASPLYDLTNKWKIYSHTFTIDALNTNYNRIWFDAYFAAGKTGTIEICGCKLIAGDSIEEYKTQILQTADNVLIKATKDDTTDVQGGQHLIESFINVAPEGVKISASKVAISDYNNYITVSENDETTLFTNQTIQNGWVYSNIAGSSWLSPVQANWTSNDERYRITGKVKAPAAGCAVFVIYGRLADGTGASGTYSNSVTIPIPSANTEVDIDTIIRTNSTNLLSRPKCNVCIIFCSTSTWTSTYQKGYFKELKMQRMSGASLIVDGSITADKIATGAITVGDMNADTKEEVLNSNILVGGANLFPHTRYMEDCSVGSDGHFYNSTSRNSDHYRYVRLVGSSANDNWNGVVSIGPTLPIGDIMNGVDIYTLSFEYYSSTAVNIMAVIAGTARNAGIVAGNRTKFTNWQSTVSIPSSGGEWKRYSFNSRTITTSQLTSGSGDVNSFYIQFYNRTDDAQFNIRHVKLEKGNKATAWSPASGDDWSSGVNILRGTDKMKSGTTYEKGAFYASGVGTDNVNGTVSFNQTVSNPPIPNATKGVVIKVNKASINVGFAQQGVPMHKGAITFSCWAKGTAGDLILLQTDWIDSASGKYDDTGNGKVFEIIDSNWHKYEWTRVVNVDYSNPVTTVNGTTYSHNAGYVYFQSPTVGHTLTVIAPMFEYGTVASSWTPQTTESNITRIDDNGIRIHPASTEDNSVLINGNGMYIYQNNIQRAYFEANAAAIGTAGKGRAIIKDDGLHVYTYDTAQHDVGFFGSTARVGLGNSSRFLMNADSLEGWNSSNKRYFQVSASGLKYGTDLANTVETTTGAQSKADAAAKTATTYITDIDSKNGITLKTANNTNDYLEIKSGGINIWKNGATRAQFQNDWLFIGNGSGARITMNTTDSGAYIYMADQNNKSRFRADSSGVKVGHYDKASGETDSDVNYAYIKSDGMHVYQANADVAYFGTSARIGASNAPHVSISKSGTTTNAALKFDAYNSASKNFGSLYFAADRSANSFSSYFMARDIDDPGSVAKQAGISLLAGSDPIVSITGKKLWVESIYRAVPNADRTTHTISADAVGTIKSLDTTSASVSLSAETWTDLKGGFVQLGSGTWIIMGTAIFGGSASGKCGLRLCVSTKGAYNNDRTSYTTGSTMMPVASNSTRTLAFAIINTTEGATQCWLNAYSTKADTISEYHIRAVHIF